MSSVPQEVRERVIARDDGQCQVCGKAREDDGATLHAHHVVPRDDGGESVPDNLITLCERHHSRVHRQGAPEKDLPSINASEYPAQLSEADRDILAVIKRDGASQMTEIAEASGVSYEHVRRRLWAMMADGVVGRWYDGRWDFPEHVELSAKCRWPDRSDRAGKLGAHEVMRRMRDHGMDEERISDIVGLHRRSVRTAIDHAEALDVPLDDKEGTKSETVGAEETTLDDHVEEADESEGPEAADTDAELRPVIDDLQSVVAALEEVAD